MKTFFLTTLLLNLVSSQSLLDATAPYTQLSTFRALLIASPALALNYTRSEGSGSQKTLLLPSNIAFDTYFSVFGTEFTSLSPATLAATFAYHTLNASYTSTNFKGNDGVLAQTRLSEDKYNHRNGSGGQVLFISDSGSSSSTSKRATPPGSTFKVIPLSGGLESRQDNQVGSTANVTSGLGSAVVLHAVDGSWDGGKFHIVDGFLTLPKTCTDTMAAKSQQLSSLNTALARTNLTDVLNNLANVTCLAPLNSAFLSSGSPEANLNSSLLADALKFHTLPIAMYSTEIKDGLVVTSVGGQQVKVTVKDGTTWFNDARVVQKNVITNNGVIQILDKIMSPMNTTTSSTSSGTPTATGSASGTASPSATGTGKTSGASGLRGCVYGGLSSVIAASVMSFLSF
ncbi:FAS1 domain-containing protein [Tricladium varicosporioides]|nr:FAS1 domain-containing protein [Hymenoscyphus varicosporioides]